MSILIDRSGVAYESKTPRFRLCDNQNYSTLQWFPQNQNVLMVNARPRRLFGPHGSGPEDDGHEGKGGAGMLIALVVGYKFGVWATVQTMKRLAEQKLTAAEFRQYQELLFKVYE